MIFSPALNFRPVKPSSARSPQGQDGASAGCVWSGLPGWKAAGRRAGIMGRLRARDCMLLWPPRSRSRREKPSGKCDRCGSVRAQHQRVLVSIQGVFHRSHVFHPVAEGVGLDRQRAASARCQPSARPGSCPATNACPPRPISARSARICRTRLPSGTASAAEHLRAAREDNSILPRSAQRRRADQRACATCTLAGWLLRPLPRPYRRAARLR